jgi:hypothetical protein
MARFNLADVGGKAFLLPMAEQAYREVENSLRGHDSDGGQVLDARLVDAEAGIRRREAVGRNMQYRGRCGECERRDSDV